MKNVALHIDNISDSRRTVRFLLEEAGLDVLSCRDSKAAERFAPGRDFQVLIVDGAGFAYAKAATSQCQGAQIPVIVLSVSPEAGAFPADARISKGDPDWPTKMLGELRAHLPGAVPALRSTHDKELSPAGHALAAFRRDLPNLLKEHPGLWAAYDGERLLGCAPTKWELHQQCLSRGLKPGHFIVRCIEPEAEEIVVGPGLAAEFE